MNLTSAEWLIVILLAIGVVVLVIGLLGRVRWRIVLVGGLLTAIAVFLLIQVVFEEPEADPSPGPSVTMAPTARPPSPGPSTAPGP